jgi:hypothetical protein
VCNCDISAFRSGSVLRAQASAEDMKIDLKSSCLFYWFPAYGSKGPKVGGGFCDPQFHWN